MPICDGCGAQADEAHIRQRIERLELATRFRPIHIQVLLLDAAPPAKLEDYFYRATTNSEQRSVASRMYFDELAKCIGQVAGTHTQEDSTLAEFQKRGFFLAYAVECPVESSSELAQMIKRLAPTVALRVNSSYKPKFVAPISRLVQDVIPVLQSKGWGDKIILNDNKPFDDPFLGDPQRQAEFGTALGDRLAKALARQS
jgi:hypothetical protein